MENTSRRDFFKTLGVCLVATNILRPMTALAASRSREPVSLNPAEWRCVEAICAEIIPTDQDPGATEAGCVNFIDKALSAEDARALPLYQEALGIIDGLCLKTHGKVFADLASPLRCQLLSEMEQGTLAGWTGKMARSQDFFMTIRFHTLFGFAADPKYGGNRDYAGWKLMGFPGPLHVSGGVNEEQLMGREPVIPVWEADGAGGHGHSKHG